MQKVAILGGGESGVGAAILAKKRGEEVFLSDAGKIQDRFIHILKDYEIPFEEGTHSIKTFFDADIIVKSPGIPEHVPFIQKLRQKNKTIISEIEYGFRHTQAKIIAITGSNGKTTTTSLIYHLLKSAGIHVALGGNIGKSFAWLVAETNPDCFVLEISSFQLDDIQQFRPDVALLLNITPDHLDRYQYSMEKYAAAKLKVTQNQTAGDVFIFNAEDPVSRQEMSLDSIRAHTKSFALSYQENVNAWVDQQQFIVDSRVITEVKQMPLIGKHNQANALAALLAIESFHIDNQQIASSLATFSSIEHRLEKVRDINGITFINDSKATNVDAVYYALEAVEGPIVWVVGGIDKGNDYQMLLPFVEDKVKVIVVLGESVEKFKTSFQKPIFQTMTMEATVNKAHELAEENDTVLLSPACSSFDLFRNYEERGRQFKKFVNEL